MSARTTWPVSLRIPCGKHNAKVIRLLRTVTPSPVGEINEAIGEGEPLHVCNLFGLSHEEDEKKLLSLLSELEALGLVPELFISGHLETKQYLLNVLQTHHEIAYDVAMETELEIGEPSEEAKAWATGKFRYPK